MLRPSPMHGWMISSSSLPGEDNNRGARPSQWFGSACSSSFDDREIEMATQSASAVPQLGELLRYWRRERGKSQLDLSLDTGISQRHLSFVESGRSTPSRDLLLTVSEKLDIPLRERNVLLLASGYAPVYEEPSWDIPQMAVVTKAIDRMLLQ